jgi:flagellar motor switch protein FliG
VKCSSFRNHLIDWLYQELEASEVEAMQQKIVDIVRTLEDSGEISRPTGDVEEQYID